MALRGDALYGDYKAKEAHYYASDRSDMLGYLPGKVSRLLDIGCGGGEFGARVKRERGAEVWGVELYAPAAQEASTKLDRVLSEPFTPASNLPPSFFDCITFNDVLEHMADPYEAVEYARTLLVPGGHVAASIPNMRYFNTMWELLVQKDFRYKDSGVQDRTHLRFFTKRSMVEMFAAAGFEVLSVEGLNPVESRKFSILNTLTFGWLSDMRYQQYALSAVRK